MKHDLFSFFDQVKHTEGNSTPHIYSIRTGTPDIFVVSGFWRYVDDVFSCEDKTRRAAYVEALDKGTQKRNKKEMADILASLGGKISFTNSYRGVSFWLTCPKENRKKVVALLYEHIYEPRLSSKEIETIQSAAVTELSQKKDSTEVNAKVALSQFLYKEKHPDHKISLDDAIRLIEHTSVEDVQKMHKKFAYEDMTIVAGGDVVHEDVVELFSQFRRSEKKETPAGFSKERNTIKVFQEKSIFIPHKTSVDVFISGHTEFTLDQKEEYAFELGIDALGSGFCGRLMSRVREEKSLTYRVNASVAKPLFDTPVRWQAYASFAPHLLEKGEEALLHELKLIKKGITKEEFQNTKSKILGSFPLSFDTTSAIVGDIRTQLFIEKAFDRTRTNFDMFRKVTHKEVDDALQAIDLSRAVLVRAGTFSEGEENTLTKKKEGKRKK